MVWLGTLIGVVIVIAWIAAFVDIVRRRHNRTGASTAAWVIGSDLPDRRNDHVLPHERGLRRRAWRQRRRATRTRRDSVASASSRSLSPGSVDTGGM